MYELLLSFPTYGLTYSSCRPCSSFFLLVHAVILVIISQELIFQTQPLDQLLREFFEPYFWRLFFKFWESRNIWVNNKNIYRGFWFLKRFDWSSCLRRQRKSEANGRRERAWFRQVREEYRRRCRIAIAAAVAAAAAAAAAAIASIWWTRHLSRAVGRRWSST